jgi:hypothetical protein
MGLVAPLGELTQLDGTRLSVSRNPKPGVFGVHDIVASPAPAGTVVRVGRTSGAV